MADRKHIIHLLENSLLDFEMLYKKYVEEKGAIPFDVFTEVMGVYAQRVGLFSVYSCFAEINVLRNKEGVVIKYC